MSLSVKNTLGGGKPEGLYAWKKNEIGSEVKEANESISTIPFNFRGGSSVVLNGEIHVLGTSDGSNNTQHYKWNGSSWTNASTLPYKFYYGAAVILNGEIHIFGGTGSSYNKNHYKWNGTRWVSVSTLPYDFYLGSAVVFNGEIHILGGSNGYGTSHYKWNGSSWINASTLPYDFYGGSAIVFNNEIHILGGYPSAYRRSHYKWDGSTWTSVSTIPYDFYYCSAVVFDNSLHVIGGVPSDYQRNHYKFDGSSWISVGTLPYTFYQGCAVVFNNEIHILGSGSSTSYYMNHYLIMHYVTVYTFLNYIVSDKETAYPDGGEKGGYWYERVNSISGTDKIIFDAVNQLIPDDVKALSLVHTEEITPASDSNVLQHSYGKEPYHFIITTEDFEWSSGLTLAVTNITYDIMSNETMRKYLLSGEKYIESGVSTYINISSRGIGNSQNSYEFIAGHTYKLYVFA